MAAPRITTGLWVQAQPPLGLLHQQIMAARLFRLDTITIWDHLQDFVPQALWDTNTSWLAAVRPSPHAYFEFQTLLGHLAGRVGGLRLSVGVTEAIRRHPVVIAQAMMTLAHLTKRAPILGIGAGERENTEPYGLNLSQAVSRLEEALQVIRLCFTSRGPVDFQGQFFRLDQAMMDLQPPPGRTPPIWLAAHGPRMLRLTGQYADGWYPSAMFTPEEYAAKLAVIREAARAAGRDPAAITPALHIGVVLGPNRAAVRDILTTRLGRYLALTLTTAEQWRRRGLNHPFGETYRGYIDIVPEAWSRQQLDEAIAAAPDDLAEDIAMCGTADEIATRLQALGEAGLRHVDLLPMSGIVSRRLAYESLLGVRHIAGRLRSGR